MQKLVAIIVSEERKEKALQQRVFFYPRFSLIKVKLMLQNHHILRDFTRCCLAFLFQQNARTRSCKYIETTRSDIEATNIVRFIQVFLP